VTSDIEEACEALVGSTFCPSDGDQCRGCEYRELNDGPDALTMQQALVIVRGILNVIPHSSQFVTVRSALGVVREVMQQKLTEGVR
jgi:hypothetical protein